MISVLDESHASKGELVDVAESFEEGIEVVELIVESNEEPLEEDFEEDDEHHVDQEELQHDFGQVQKHPHYESRLREDHQHAEQLNHDQQDEQKRGVQKEELLRTNRIHSDQVGLYKRRQVQRKQQSVH